MCPTKCWSKAVNIEARQSHHLPKVASLAHVDQSRASATQNRTPQIRHCFQMQMLLVTTQVTKENVAMKPCKLGNHLLFSRAEILAVGNIVHHTLQAHSWKPQKWRESLQLFRRVAAYCVCIRVIAHVRKGQLCVWVIFHTLAPRTKAVGPIIMQASHAGIQPF